jgi:hypothetical protein
MRCPSDGEENPNGIEHLSELNQRACFGQPGASPRISGSASHEIEYQSRDPSPGTTIMNILILSKTAQLA